MLRANGEHSAMARRWFGLRKTISYGRLRVRSKAMTIRLSTEIRTTKTGRRVEDLKIGDLVFTLSSESKPIKWIGRQRFKKDVGSPWPKSLLPVRVSRFALDEHTPNRDLYVSPNHGLLLDGVLIPAIYLVNGTSIVRPCLRVLKRSTTSTSS
jgi:hypothetical protein